MLKDIVGADVAVVETVAHARAALHFFPDADVICDVGGCDVKIMLLRHGAVTDFRLNSQCSSGNGAFLQGVAERYGVPLESYAERAFQAKSLPALAMGCGVFLQSDIVNQQRKGWSAEEIMASLAAVLPLNVWVYAGQLQNLRAVGRKFVLQGGTHRNLAVVKAQVDFITGKVPDAEIVIHPYAGEAGAIGAALCALDAWRGGEPSRFRGFDAIEALSYRSTTNEDTVCRWCACNCKRTFIDVRASRGDGTAVEQGSRRRRLGTRHQRQFLPEGPGRGRERDADREGPARGGQACLSQRGGNGSQRRVPSIQGANLSFTATRTTRHSSPRSKESGIRCRRPIASFVLSCAVGSVGPDTLAWEGPANDHVSARSYPLGIASHCVAARFYWMRRDHRHRTVAAAGAVPSPSVPSVQR